MNPMLYTLIKSSSTLLQIPAIFETDISDNGENPESGDTPVSGVSISHHPTTPNVGSGNTLNQSSVTTASDLNRSVFPRGPPGVYGEMQKTWRTSGNKKMNKVSNSEL